MFLSSIRLILTNIALSNHGRYVKYFAMDSAPGDTAANNDGGHFNPIYLCQGLYTCTLRKRSHSLPKKRK